MKTLDAWTGWAAVATLAVAWCLESSWLAGG
jgi:hypothetical protein